MRTEIYQGHELRVVAAPVVEEECEYGPCQRYDRDNEQHQDVVGRHHVAVDVAVDEVGQHAHNGNEGEDLGESPEDEADCEEHCGGSCALSSDISSSVYKCPWRFATMAVKSVARRRKRGRCCQLHMELIERQAGTMSYVVGVCSRRPVTQ